MEYIFVTWVPENRIWEFLKKSIFWPKRVFLNFFLGHFLDKFRHFGVGDLKFGIYVKNVET